MKTLMWGEYEFVGHTNTLFAEGPGKYSFIYARPQLDAGVAAD